MRTVVTCACSTSCCRSAVPCATCPTSRSAPRAARRSAGCTRPCASAAGRPVRGPSGAAPSAPDGGSRSSMRGRRSCTTRAPERSCGRGRSVAGGASRARPRCSSRRSFRRLRSSASSRFRAIPSGHGAAATFLREPWRSSWLPSGGCPLTTCSSVGAFSPASADCPSTRGDGTFATACRRARACPRRRASWTTCTPREQRWTPARGPVGGPARIVSTS